jgi:hypothetical protein
MERMALVVCTGHRATILRMAGVENSDFRAVFVSTAVTK